MANFVSAIPYRGGSTNTATALDFLRTTMFSVQTGDRPDVPNVAVLLTDGSSNDRKATIEAALKVKKVAHVVVLGIGGWTDEQELNGMQEH